MSTLNNKEYRGFIERLKKARIDAGLTQIEVAKKLNKPQSYISKIENCERRVDVLEVKKLSRLYEINIIKLIAK